MGRFIEPDYDDAAWVGYRVAELLPLEQRLQQQLLEIDDPNTRLSLLAPLIEVRQ
jgi:Lon protease-like protein